MGISAVLKYEAGLHTSGPWMDAFIYSYRFVIVITLTATSEFIYVLLQTNEVWDREYMGGFADCMLSVMTTIVQ